MAGKVTAGLAKVMAAYRRDYDMRVCRCGPDGRWWRVHDYACCHLQADCLESGISSGPLRSITSMENLYLYHFNPDLALYIWSVPPTIYVTDHEIHNLTTLLSLPFK